MEQLDKQQQQINSRIRSLYKAYPFLVDDTKQLMNELFKTYGLRLTRQQYKAFRAMPSVEVLYREARRIRSADNLVASKPVEDHRFNLWKWFRHA